MTADDQYRALPLHASEPIPTEAERVAEEQAGADSDAPTLAFADLAVSSCSGTTPSQSAEAPAVRVPAHAGPLTVLVSEDDPAIRKTVRRMLEGAGYEVREATSGRDALARLREGRAIHFLVTDLKMDDGSGGWLLAQLAYEFPALLPRTLIISGDATSTSAAHLVTRWRCPVLAKPFNAATLVRLLQSLSGEEPRAT
jgi:CheY-like chemotaxis protein